MEDMKDLHDNFGVMDEKERWEFEDELFKLFRLKEDSDSFWEIYPTGYEEFYLYNRSQLKKVNIVSYVNKKLVKDLAHIQLYSGCMHDGPCALRDSINYEYRKFETYIVIGFIYLKYQLDIPKSLKDDILNTVHKRIYIDKDYLYGNQAVHLNKFKECIEKEDGEGLTNVGSVLPKRTIYE
jgi:hypothetical protein